MLHLLVGIYFGTGDKEDRFICQLSQDKPT